MKDLNALLGLPEDATIEQQIEAVTKLLAENEALAKASKLPKGAKPADLAAKIAAGLSEGQALEVLAMQREHDATKPHDALPGDEAEPKKAKK